MKAETNITKLDNAHLTITVKVTKQFRLRMWLGLRLMQLGARVTGATVKVNHE